MTDMRDELRKAAALDRARPDWTKSRMPTIAAPMTDQPRAYLDPLHDELDRLRTENKALTDERVAWSDELAHSDSLLQQAEAELATVRDTLHRRTQSHAALVRTRLACPTCSTLPLEETPGE